MAEGGGGGRVGKVWCWGCEGKEWGGGWCYGGGEGEGEKEGEGEGMGRGDRDETRDGDLSECKDAQVVTGEQAHKRGLYMYHSYFIAISKTSEQSTTELLR